MSVIQSLVVNLSAETSRYTRGIKSAQRQTLTFERTVTSASRGINTALGALGIGVGIGSAVAFLKSSVEAAEESRKASKQLEAVLTATGHAAGFTSQQLEKYASDLQRVTNFEDDATVSAMAMLASFKNIRGDVFTSAVKGAMDLSEALGKDLQSAVMMLGKALDDPAEGISKLSRIGITFTEQEKEQIKALVEHNGLLEAQGMILDKLAGKFGGAAEKMKSSWGAAEIAWGEFKEAVGEQIGGGNAGGGFAGLFEKWTRDISGELSPLGGVGEPGPAVPPAPAKNRHRFREAFEADAARAERFKEREDAIHAWLADVDKHEEDRKERAQREKDSARENAAQEATREAERLKEERKNAIRNAVHQLRAEGMPEAGATGALEAGSSAAVSAVLGGMNRGRMAEQRDERQAVNIDKIRRLLEAQEREKLKEEIIIELVGE